MKSSQVVNVFFCYSSNDKSFVRDFYNYLRREDWILPWMDERDLLPGQDWNNQIVKAVRSANAVIIFLSKNSVSKEGYIQKELRLILDIAEEKPEDSIYIIPVRIDNCVVPRSLQKWHYVDCFSKSQLDFTYERVIESLHLRATSLRILVSQSTLDKIDVFDKNTPHQIPVPPKNFVGRKGELAEIEDYVKLGNKLFVCVQGAGGIGKTSFGLKLSERLNQYYGDGQVYMDLLGAADQEPVRPEDIMFHVVRAYNRDYQYPEKENLLHGDYRTVLHGKRTLLFFDNARDAKQIEAIVPLNTCGIIVTSRQHIYMPEMWTFNLERLQEDDAINLARDIANRLSIAEAKEISTLCDYLPRMIRQAASVLREMPNMTSQEYLFELRQEATRLSLVESSVSLSYKLLNDEYKKLWRLLALFPRDFELEMAGNLWKVNKAIALKAISEMVQYSLVGFNRSTQFGNETVRYWLHDLDRLFADSLLTVQERKEYRLGQIYTLLFKMPGAFMPEKAAGLDATIQFKFTGDEPGEWYATIKDGKCEVAKGAHASPKMTLTADSADYVKIFTGEIDGMQAFMQGKLKLAGDLNLAMKLTQMFKIK